MTDISETIARAKWAADNAAGNFNTVIRISDLRALLDAAEAGVRAAEYDLLLQRLNAALDALWNDDDREHPPWLERHAKPITAIQQECERALKGRPSWTCPMRGKTLELCGVRDHGNDIRTCTVGGCPHMPVAQGDAA